jgi:hypothetical protein
VSIYLIANNADGFTHAIDLLANVLGENPLILLAVVHSKFYWNCEPFSSVFNL